MSTAAIPVHVGLVDDTGSIGHARLAKVAGALNEQVAADFSPIWHVRASVGVYPPDAVTPGIWAIRVRSKLDAPGAAGYHTDENGQPVAYVEFGHDWPMTASHELVEMLADPWGMRLHQARLPAGIEGSYKKFGLASRTSRVSYLLEVGDPCEMTSYEVGGVDLSDFLYPAWYRTTQPANARYSHAGGCTGPRQVSEGGYVSFCHGPEWFQVFAYDGKFEVKALGRFDKNDHVSLRAWTDECARQFRA
jgi:hypothetical protein